MTLTRHHTLHGPRWALDGMALPGDLSLGYLLGVRREAIVSQLAAMPTESLDATDLLPPIEADQEVWAAGVTYLRSRNERQAESTVADVYGAVYVADRPELFFKAVGWRAMGHGQPIRIRRDSTWNVPEPELTLVVNAFGEIVGYTAGNDVSSRSIEGENPLYLPQAKTYDGSCAVGPGIVLASAEELVGIGIHLSIRRGGDEVFVGDTRTSEMKRQLPELVEFLVRETAFPRGAFLMTGTGIVPTQDFTLLTGDEVSVTVGELTLVNTVNA